MAKHLDPAASQLVCAVLVSPALVLGAGCASSTPAPAPPEASPVAAAVASPSSEAPAGPNAFSGFYKIKYDSGTAETWQAVPCGDGCADMQKKEFGPVAPTITGQAHLDDTTWTLMVRRPDAGVCDDGSTYEGIQVWTWDAKTLAGALNGHQLVDACELPAGTPFDEDRFTLEKQSREAPPDGYRSS